MNNIDNMQHLQEQSTPKNSLRNPQTGMGEGTLYGKELDQPPLWTKLDRNIFRFLNIFAFFKKEKERRKEKNSKNSLHSASV